MSKLKIISYDERRDLQADKYVNGKIKELKPLDHTHSLSVKVSFENKEFDIYVVGKDNVNNCHEWLKTLILQEDELPSEPRWGRGTE